MPQTAPQGRERSHLLTHSAANDEPPLCLLRRRLHDICLRPLDISSTRWPPSLAMRMLGLEAAEWAWARLRNSLTDRPIMSYDPGTCFSSKPAFSASHEATDCAAAGRRGGRYKEVERNALRSGPVMPMPYPNSAGETWTAGGSGSGRTYRAVRARHARRDRCQCEEHMSRCPVTQTERLARRRTAGRAKFHIQLHRNAV